VKAEAAAQADPIFEIYDIFANRWGETQTAIDMARQCPEYRHIAEACDEGNFMQAAEWVVESYIRVAFPDPLFFHAVPDNTDFLQHVPNLLNVLVSHFRLKENDGRGGPIWRRLHLAKRVFQDSGQITLLKRVAAGKADPSLLWDRMRTQPWQIQTAHEIAALGVKEGYVSMLDHPCEPNLLASAGMTVKDALRLTIQNARDFYEAAVTRQLPPGFKPVFVLQGWDLADYDYCLRAYEEIGILNQVRFHNAILAGGSTCMRTPTQKTGPGLYSVYEHIHSRFPHGEMHALGIARPEWVAHLFKKGYVTRADSGSASTDAGLNNEPYKVKGYRYQFLNNAVYAAHMLDLEYRIRVALHGAETLPGRPNAPGRGKKTKKMAVLNRPTAQLTLNDMWHRMPARAERFGAIQVSGL